MKYSYRLEGLGCACCAEKMERAVRKIEGVESASVAFMTARMSIEAGEGDIARIEEQAAAAIKKIEAGCRMRRA
ncbi:MAG: cation transporter [Candidatus Methanoplasma sp.]|jgi:copper chaperone CopZ|nr:cation transporter [Candidatus Methanoplasma sp.]